MGTGRCGRRDPRSRDRADRARLKLGASAPASFRWRRHLRPTAAPLQLPASAKAGSSRVSCISLGRRLQSLIERRVEPQLDVRQHLRHPLAQPLQHRLEERERLSFILV